MMVARSTRAAARVCGGGHLSDDGRMMLGVRAALEWAFAVECASLEFDEVGAVGPQGFGARSATANICDMLSLGDEPGVGVCVDASGGRSYPHDDAEVIAGIVRSELDWCDAITVAERARAMAPPAWQLAATACQPRAWKGASRHGRFAQTEAMPPCTYRSGARLVRYTPVICPVHYSPTAQQVGAARRAYLQWWANLQHLRCVLKSHSFQRFVLTDAMPVLSPWKKHIDEPLPILT